MAGKALKEVEPLAFNPLKSEIAITVATGALECCVKQYKHVQKNPTTIGLYEDSIRKAVSIIDAMSTDIRGSVEQVNQLRELQEYKARKANRKNRANGAHKIDNETHIKRL